MFSSNLQRGSAAGWVIAIIVIVLIILGVLFLGDQGAETDLDLENGTTTADVVEDAEDENADDTAAPANADTDANADADTDAAGAETDTEESAE